MRTRKTTKIDMHVHTKGSDGWGTPESIARYAVERGLDGLVITDHHRTITPESDAVAARCREAGLLVFRGCEYSTSEGHVLIYGVIAENLELPRYPEMQFVIDRVNEAGGVAIPAHPYHGYKYKLGDKLLDLEGIKAVEVRNGQNEVRAPWENDEAREVVKASEWASVGGSDAHDAKYVGVCFTEFKGTVRTEKQLLKALRQGKHVARRNNRAIRVLTRARMAWLAEEERKKKELGTVQAGSFVWEDEEPYRYSSSTVGEV